MGDLAMRETVTYDVAALLTNANTIQTTVRIINSKIDRLENLLLDDHIRSFCGAGWELNQIWDGYSKRWPNRSDFMQEGFRRFDCRTILEIVGDAFDRIDIGQADHRTLEFWDDFAFLRLVLIHVESTMPFEGVS
jgi:hypothetical protein